MKNIVIIGGGTGTFTLLNGLRKYPSNNTVIVSSADDGGSTGILRKELGVMPPGDIRQCLVGLSYTQKEIQDLFNFRFDKGSLAGHSVGNIILAALEKIAGVEQGINIAAKILNVRGQVLPVTLQPTILSAVLVNGKKIMGEHNIDIREKRPKIKSISLKPNVAANPKALRALEQADVIILGPGDLYTSILPSLLVPGVKKSVDSSKATKVLVTNIMTTPGQTENFSPADFANVVNSYLGGKKLDKIIVNSKKPSSSALAVYKKEAAKFITPDISKIEGVQVISADLLSTVVHKKAKGDKLNTRSSLRHNSDKLAKLIWGLV